MARLEIDLELTAKLLDLKAAREQNGGRWPSTLRGIEESAACPRARWIYETGGDGKMSLALDYHVPSGTGIVLPTLYVSATAER